MSKTNAFVLPAGLEIDLSGNTLSLGYEGDVVLEQSFGRPLGEVYAKGDLTLKLDRISGALRSGGRMVLDGPVDADVVHGREVHIGKQDVRCRAISADERIVIGAARLQVDIIIAPEIVLDPKAAGRVTVIESRNDPGPTKIKGGFSLKEYGEIVGDVEAFLAERGLQPLSADGSSRAAAPAEEEEEEEDEDEPAASATSATPEIPAARSFEATPEPEEETADPLSLSIEDLEPIAEPEAEPEPEPDGDELHPKLMDAVKRIATCYEGKETPPAVHELRELVESRDYDRLRENITEVWNGLLGFHQKKGIRPHHQVTHAFNVIHGLVQQG